MDLYALAPWFAVAIGVAVVAFLVLKLFRIKKMPPTDEARVGEYKISLDVGTHLVPYEGTLYYFNKLLNPRNLHIYAKSLDKNGDLEALHKHLKKNAYFYAMRIGMKKIAFISYRHPIEISPYFKSEEGTGRKIVYATGTIGKPASDIKDNVLGGGGFQHVTFQPLNLSKYTLNPEQYNKLDNLGKILIDLHEKVPRLSELDAKDELLRIAENKADERADDLGKAVDEKEYYKDQTKRASPTTRGEEIIQLPPWLTQYGPYIVSAVIGWMLSLNIPQLASYHPIVLALGFTGAWFAIKNWILPRI